MSPFWHRVWRALGGKPYVKPVVVEPEPPLVNRPPRPTLCPVCKRAVWTRDHAHTPDEVLNR